MLKSLFLITLTLAIAIGGGAGSVWWMMEEVQDFGALTVGQWTVNPTEGTPEADPYAKARFARDGKLALGSSEGAQFVALRDSTGALLRGNCDYVVSGGMPVSRFWTLHPTGPSLSPTTHASHSQALLREASGAFTITASRHPAPGNWLRIETDGVYRLVLAVYDTPTIGTADFADVTLPRIVRERCDG
ncbi:MAG: DUF1214 domain-containing protein [Aliihoeflea sp.]